MSKLVYTKINDNYKISLNNVNLGELQMLEDGFYYWYIEPFVSECISSWSSWILKDIYNKIEDLNKEWNDIINKEFNEKNN